MRQYEDVERTVFTRSECVKASCDMCGRQADNPNGINKNAGFDWGGIGMGGGMIEAHYIVHGESKLEQLDLCYECADWLIETIKHNRKVENGLIRRPTDV